MGQSHYTEQEACEEIFRLAGDPDLKPGPVRKVARRVAAGEMPIEDVQHTIELAREKVHFGKCPFVWVYLIGAWRGYFAKRGWAWRLKIEN